MRVSCICATFNRPPGHQWLLEEAIESFLRQDYPNKELVVISDCPGQELACEAPGVVVVNVPRRFRSLGEKLNAAVAMSSGSLLARWDDDDISLPWRLSQALRLIGEADYFNPGGYWFEDRSGVHQPASIGYAHACSLMTRWAFDLLGGYPHLTVGEDATMDGWLREHPAVRVSDVPPLAPEHWSYIVRWGVSPVHVSSRAPEDAHAEVGALPVRPGRYELRPRWQVDWVADVRRALGGRAAVAQGV
jgi:glycosyltransferase involved in cell wall biosynthesis